MMGGTVQDKDLNQFFPNLSVKSFIFSNSQNPRSTTLLALPTRASQGSSLIFDLICDFSSSMANSSGQSKVIVALRLALSLLTVLFWVRGSSTEDLVCCCLVAAGSRTQQLQFPQMEEMDEMECSLAAWSSSQKELEISNIEIQSLFPLGDPLTSSSKNSLPFLEQNLRSISKNCVKTSNMEELISPISCGLLLKQKSISFQHSQKAGIFSLPISTQATGQSPSAYDIAFSPLRMSPLVKLAKARKLLLQMRSFNLVSLPLFLSCWPSLPPRKRNSKTAKVNISQKEAFSRKMHRAYCLATPEGRK